MQFHLTPTSLLCTSPRKYRQLCPDMVQRHIAQDSQTRWEKPRAQLAANLERWLQRRAGAGAGAGAGGAVGTGGADFWDVSGKVRDGWEAGSGVCLLPVPLSSHADNESCFVGGICNLPSLFFS